MSNTPNWIEKFNISAELKTEFDKQSSPAKNFLVWCVEQGHVSEQEYLSWASEQFQLPIVSDQFFKSDDAKTKWRATWVTARFLYQWTNDFMPLDEASGVIRVGCFEAPGENSTAKLEQPVAFVLAPLSGLKSLWFEAFPQPLQQPEPPQLSDQPQDTITITPVTAVTAVVAEVDAQVAGPPPTPQEFDANSLMASWGVQADPEPEISAPTEDVALSETEAVMPEGFAMPENFSAIDIPIPTLNIPAPTLTTATKAVQPSEVVETIAPKPTLFVEAKTPPIPPMAPATLGKSSGEHLGLIELRGAKEKFEECQNLAEVANCAFAKFSRYFDRHMILVMKGFELRPHAWAGNWDLRSTRPAGINLDQPSIFRIVSRSQMPYHGYTKPSPTNDFFFGEWTNGTPPAHLTVLPLLVNNQLIGMILGATDSTLDLKVALMDTERWAAELAPHIQRTKATSPKAA